MVSAMAACSLTGCTVSYYDERASELHVFGVGHMRMKVPEDDGHTVYYQVDAYGATAGKTRDGAHAGIGLYRETGVDVADDTALCFEWPDGSLFNIRIGQAFPVNPKDGCIHEVLE